MSRVLHRRRVQWKVSAVVQDFALVPQAVIVIVQNAYVKTT